MHLAVVSFLKWVGTTLKMSFLTNVNLSVRNCPNSVISLFKFSKSKSIPISILKVFVRFYLHHRMQVVQETDEIQEDLKNCIQENGIQQDIQTKPLNLSPGVMRLHALLNKTLRIVMSDGRILIGIFLCTDRDANVILGSCSEYLPQDPNATTNEEPRMLGLVMIPGKHIVSISRDLSEFKDTDQFLNNGTVK